MKRLLGDQIKLHNYGKYLLQHKNTRNRSSTATSSSSSGGPPHPPLLSHLHHREEGGITLFKEKVNQVMLLYEDFIGIKQVKEAQNRVLSAETCFKASQQQRRAAQERLTAVQNQLRVLRMDIDRTARGDNRYLELIKQEIDIIREERDVRSQFEELEERERELFSELSNALRMSHEKERAQGEKTKYWSIFGSLVGAFLGIVGATLNTRMRHQQTKDILLQTSSHVAKIEESVQALSVKLGMDHHPSSSSSSLPSANNNTDPKSVALLLTSIQDQEKLLRISVDTLMSVTKTVESVASQLSTNNANEARNPVYFDMSEVTPVSIVSNEQGAVIVTFFLLMISAIAYTRY